MQVLETCELETEVLIYWQRVQISSVQLQNFIFIGDLIKYMPLTHASLLGTLFFWYPSENMPVQTMSNAIYKGM